MRICQDVYDREIVVIKQEDEACGRVVGNMEKFTSLPVSSSLFLDR